MARSPRDDAQSKPQSTYSAPALEKGFNVIELLATAPDGLTLSEIAARMGFNSMSEIFRIIIVMERRGWLAKNPDTDRYAVTHKVLETVFRALPTHELSLVAAPLMLELAQAIQQSCHVVVLNGAKGLIIMRQESPGPTAFVVKRGVTIDAVRTCSGHVLMAFCEPSIAAQVLAQNPVLPEEETARIEKVRAQGYEMMPSIRTRGVTDMACPIIGFDGYAVGTLTVPFLELIDGTEQVTRKAALELVKSYAKRISQGLGAPSL
ncbi:IclR family transcriptional regulator [Asticcacaulis sp. YBE204]|uniref:IclR family transcriptional regulator n=1 Tax=Asticcacaulis sp. YBE204 TaxID=1282363 RepID=UPI0003C3D070|nr:IclR family transcriptional regulator [Asticcacaulis sp. YBE204]ESQ78341.1 hypothetical protein AEYBE204_14310 [Asticcacaulis sp. YBE204]